MQEELPVIQKIPALSGNQFHPTALKIKPLGVEAGTSVAKENKEIDQTSVSKDAIENGAVIDKVHEAKPYPSESELPAIDAEKTSPPKDSDVPRPAREILNKQAAFEIIDSMQSKVSLDAAADDAADLKTFPELKVANAISSKLDMLLGKKEIKQKSQKAVSNVVGVEHKFRLSLNVDNSSPSLVQSDVSNAGYSAEGSAAEARNDASPFGLSPR